MQLSSTSLKRSLGADMAAQTRSKSHFEPCLRWEKVSKTEMKALCTPKETRAGWKQDDVYYIAHLVDSKTPSLPMVLTLQTKDDIVYELGRFKSFHHAISHAMESERKRRIAYEELKKHFGPPKIPCPKCGVDEMGSVLPDGSNFCTTCQTNITDWSRANRRDSPPAC